jgi:hypothetical protein
MVRRGSLKEMEINQKVALAGDFIPIPFLRFAGSDLA